jgi:DNA-binding SARP family transcriptional activator/streptogramin lyase
VEYRILGPLDVTDGERAVTIAAGRERALLILLLLHRSGAVSVDAIVEALWPVDPPPSAAKVVQNYILRLRKALGHEAVSTVPGGYALDLGKDDLDTERASSLFATGRESLRRGAPEEAVRLIGTGLELWRGEPLSDVRYDDFVQLEIARLDEVRISAIEDQTDARLQLGQHAELVADLEQQVRRWPLRERPCVQLMTALYRSGRQADALAAYQAARAALTEQGLEPSLALRDLQRAILNQDPSLDVPPAAARLPPSGVRSRRNWAGAAVALIALIALVLTTTVLLLERQSSRRPISSLPADSLAQIDPDNGNVLRSFAVGKTPTAVALTANAAWVTSFDDRTVTRIDRATGNAKVSGSPSTPTGVAADEEGVWVISSFDGTIERLDVNGAGVLAVLRARPGLTDVAAGRGAVWITNASLGTLTHIEAGTNEVVSILRGLAKPTGVALGAGRTWVAETAGRRVDGVNAASGHIVLRIPLQLEPGELAFGDGALWAANPHDATVTRIDPYSGRQQLVSVGAAPSHIAVADGHTWVTLDRDHSLVELDSRTGAVEQRLSLANPEAVNRGHAITPGGLATDRVSVWISVQSY